MSPGRTHDVRVTATEVTKRYVEWERGEPDREWACLTLLAEHAPGLAPAPLHRWVEADGSPVVVMSRLPGRSLGGQPLTGPQVQVLGRAVRRCLQVPVPAGTPERIHGPSTLVPTVAGWLAAPADSADPTSSQDPSLVRRAAAAALERISAPGLLPDPGLTALGVTDRKPDNLLWHDGVVRFVDLEDSGASDPAFEVADTVEHLANRGVLDPDLLPAAAGLGAAERDRVRAWRPVWAAFWLGLLLTRPGAVARNPPGTTDLQARRVLYLLTS